MLMSLICFSYDAEGDILDITFGIGKPNQREGFELNDNIVLFIDRSTDCPLGLMFISYSQLLEQGLSFLDQLVEMPLTQQQHLMKILSSNLLQPFLTIVSSTNLEVQVGNPNINELMAVA